MFVVEKLIIWIKYLSDSNHNQITKNFKRFFFSSRRRHTILVSYWSSDVCSSDLSRRSRSLPDAIIEYGSERLRREVLPAVARGEATFWQGYSEPDAGSDLLALKTEARRDGDQRSEERRVGQECGSWGSART